MLEKEDDFFEEERIKLRAPLIYHMYVGRYERNGGVRAGLAKSG